MEHFGCRYPALSLRDCSISCPSSNEHISLFLSFSLSLSLSISPISLCPIHAPLGRKRQAFASITMGWWMEQHTYSTWQCPLQSYHFDVEKTDCRTERQHRPIPSVSAHFCVFYQKTSLSDNPASQCRSGITEVDINTVHGLPCSLACISLVCFFMYLVPPEIIRLCLLIVFLCHTKSAGTHHTSLQSYSA